VGVLPSFTALLWDWLCRAFWTCWLGVSCGSDGSLALGRGAKSRKKEEEEEEEEDDDDDRDT